MDDLDLPEKTSVPYVIITEQPSQGPIRFRYACEGNCSGTVVGARSSRKCKTYPSIKVKNYTGLAKVVVSCVNSVKPHSPHPHNLVGKHCSNGVCDALIDTKDMSFTFCNLGIQCVRKGDVKASLNTRKRLNIDPCQTGYCEKVKLNELCLCFQVYLKDNMTQEFSHSLPPVISNVIYDKRTNKDLTICKLSHCSASVDGGKQIILLCEKVSKGDIKVKFFERKQHNKNAWIGYGSFMESDVHKQVAITFRTPEYKPSNEKITSTIQVWIQLERPSDSSTGEPLPFEFTPSEIDSEESKHKRQRMNTNFVENLKPPLLDMASWDPLAQPCNYVHNNFDSLFKQEITQPHVDNTLYDIQKMIDTSQHHDAVFRSTNNVPSSSKIPDFNTANNGRFIRQSEFNLLGINFENDLNNYHDNSTYVHNLSNLDEDIMTDSLNRLKINEIDKIINMANNNFD